MPSWELFEKQTRSYRKFVLQGEIKISIEAACEQGWHKYIGADGIAISLNTYGESGSPEDLADYFGFTESKIIQKIKSHLNSNTI